MERCVEHGAAVQTVDQRCGIDPDIWVDMLECGHTISAKMDLWHENCVDHLEGSANARPALATALRYDPNILITRLGAEN